MFVRNRHPSFELTSAMLAEVAGAAMAAVEPAHPSRYSACAVSASPTLHNASGRVHARGRVHAYAHGRGHDRRPMVTPAASKLLADREKGRRDCQNNPVTSPSFSRWLLLFDLMRLQLVDFNENALRTWLHTYTGCYDARATHNKLI